MLFGVPRFDEATQYSYEACLRLAEALGGLQTRLLEDDATRSNFEGEIPHDDVFIFYNHGERDRLLAQGGQSNLLDLSNVDLVAGKTVYMACLSADTLGVEVWKRDGTYWGNTEIVGFTPDDKEIFYEAWNYGAILRWKEALSWKECLDQTRKKCDELIDKIDDPWGKVWLNSHRESLACYDGEAPQSKCTLRKLAIRLFGPKLGWKIPNPFSS